MEADQSNVAKACTGIPCPSSLTEITLEITAVCNCTERWGKWGNPWGDPDCPVHGADVAAKLAETSVKPMTKFLSDEVLADWFAYHPPASDMVRSAHEHVRARYGQLALEMNNLLPEGPDKTVALRAIREAMYHANAAIACAGKTFG